MNSRQDKNIQVDGKETVSMHRLLFENMEEGFSLHEIITDEQGNTINFRFIDANAAYERHTGIKREDCIGKTILEIMPHADLKQIENYGQVALTGVPIKFEYYSRTFQRHLRVRAFSPKHGLFATIFEDISERKLNEELLLQTRNNYEAFFNTIDEFLFILDEQGNVIHTNNTVIKRLGFTKEELSGQSVLMVHPPERREEAGQIVGEMLAGKAEFCPIPIITKTGIPSPVETRVKSGVWNGKPAIFGISKDISRIKLSEEKFSKIFYLNPSACGLSDLVTGCYVEVNEAFYRLFGFEKDEIIGKTAIDLGIMSSEIKNDILSKVAPNEKFVNVEAVLKAKNGDTKHVLLSAENIYVQDQQYRFTIAHDVTERKHSQEALKESELWYRILFETSPSGIMVLDENGTILEANEIILKSTLYLHDELVGKNIQLLASFDSAELVNKNILLILNGINLEHEVVNRRKDGSTCTVILRETAITLSNGQKRILSVSNDITQRKQAENEILKLNQNLEQRVIERTNQLEQINKELEFHIKEVEQFTFIASHDLQEPLRTLTTFTRILQDEFAGKLNDDGDKYLEFIYNSAERMRSLVTGLLEYSLLGKESEMTSVDCNKIVIDILSEISTSIKETKAKISVINLPTIKGYPVELRLLFQNLIINSIKFRKEKIPPEIRISAEIQEKVYFFAIEDNGIGIEEKNKEKVFVIFKQMHNHNEYDGTGIGLSHCKKIVELHGGKIWVESNKNGGSTFMFTIPI